MSLLLPLPFQDMCIQQSFSTRVSRSGLYVYSSRDSSVHILNKTAALLPSINQLPFLFLPHKYYYLFFICPTQTLTTTFSFHSQIVSAVQYCHQKHVIHRDLKVLNTRTDTHTVYILFVCVLCSMPVG